MFGSSDTSSFVFLMSGQVSAVVLTVSDWRDGIGAELYGQAGGNATWVGS